MSVHSFQWIFFDCINTLLDFKEKADRPYWYHMGEVAVKTGAYDSTDAFNLDYEQWREKRLQSHDEEEFVLQDRIRQILRGKPSESIPLSGDVIQKFVSAFVEDYTKHVVPEPGVKNMLKAWKGKVRMGVVSNFFLKDMPAHLLKAHQLDDYFDFILDSATIGWRKPSPNIYYHALALADVPKSKIGNVLFVGDNLHVDVKVPQSLGMQAIHYIKDDPLSESERCITHWDEFRPTLAK